MTAFEKADTDSRIRWATFVRQEAERRNISWAWWGFGAGFGVAFTAVWIVTSLVLTPIFIERDLKSLDDPEIYKRVNVITDFYSYKHLFETADKSQIVGEVDPWCLHLHKRVIPRIKTYLPTPTKIAICLRNPIDRSFSHYYQMVKQGWLSTPIWADLFWLRKWQNM